MRWSSARPGCRKGLPAVFIAILSVLMLISAPSDEKRLSVYSSTANYAVPVTEREGRDYVSLQAALEPLGPVRVKTDGPGWKFFYKNIEADFTAGSTRARIQNGNLDLTANFLLENDRGLVPLASLNILMSRFLGTPVVFRENARRLFIGNVAVHFTAQVTKANPATLAMNFTSPVNPMIATEPGKLRMVFSHEPLVPPGSPTLTFDNKTIPSASYDENNGLAEIAVLGTAPLFASFSNNGRTITIAAAPQPAPSAAAQPPAPAPPPNTPAPQSSTPATPAPSPAIDHSIQYFAVVDASHGGDERGAALSRDLAEKDITLAFARRISQEFQSRGFSALALRDSDATLTLDQRASLTNAVHPAVYIGVHATSEGSGIRLFTALLSEGAGNRGPFLDWDTAQSAFRSASQLTAVSMAAEFGKKQIAVRSLMSPLRPLNNLTSAALAIEISPPAGGVSEFNSTDYQQLVASSVVAGIASVSDKLMVGK